MKKLIDGIVKFRRDVLPGHRETFARLALGQSPDALFVGCSDSRVAVNVFASTDPGDLFVVRNVGNLIPPFSKAGGLTGENSVAAAIEFALGTLKVSNIILCGHSECGAMQALLKSVPAGGLGAWLQHGLPSKKTLEAGTKNLKEASEPLPRHNRLSQINVLQQIDHLKTYPIVQERLKAGNLGIHGWWFELARAEVFAYEAAESQFIAIDETEAARISARL